jgi:hypothetical protein
MLRRRLARYVDAELTPGGMTLVIELLMSQPLTMIPQSLVRRLLLLRSHPIESLQSCIKKV